MVPQTPADPTPTVTTTPDSPSGDLVECSHRMSFAQSTATIAAPRARLTRRLAILVAIAFAATAVAALAHPTTALAWDENAFSSGAERDLVALTNQQPRSRRSQVPQGLVDAVVDRAVAQQGHDQARLLQPLDPGLREGLQEDRIVGASATTWPARTSAGRPSSDSTATSTHPRDVHGLERAPRQHPGQGLGRDRCRGLQGRRRQEDVHGPVRGQVRQHQVELQAQVEAEARAQASKPHAKPAASQPKATIKAKAKPTPRHRCRAAAPSVLAAARRAVRRRRRPAVQAPAALPTTVGARRRAVAGRRG